MWFDEFNSPIGMLRVAVDETGLRYILFESNKHLPKQLSDWRQDRSPTAQAREQLLQYFAGQRSEFDLPFRLDGTDFQQRTWKKLASIPYGKTWSYTDLAVSVGSPKAVRAVGSANGRNPLPIVLPCHRVIGSNGSLTGFGGGLPIKKWLLDHEGKVASGRCDL
jgi:methylated-DNA-[protein]-cysteine S-methyltransferase